MIKEELKIKILKHAVAGVIPALIRYKGVERSLYYESLKALKDYGMITYTINRLSTSAFGGDPENIRITDYGKEFIDLYLKDLN